MYGDWGVSTLRFDAMVFLGEIVKSQGETKSISGHSRF